MSLVISLALQARTSAISRSAFYKTRLLTYLNTDAVPKKRGPKTDVLEALLKRVDGLEAKLKEKNTDGEALKGGESAVIEAEDDDDDADIAEPAPKRLATESSKSSDGEGLKIVTNLKSSSR